MPCIPHINVQYMFVPVLSSSYLRASTWASSLGNCSQETCQHINEYNLRVCMIIILYHVIILYKNAYSLTCTLAITTWLRSSFDLHMILVKLPYCTIFVLPIRVCSEQQSMHGVVFALGSRRHQLIQM